MMFLEYNLKESHASTNIEFMWRGNKLSSYTAESTTPLNNCNEISALHLAHYHWYGSYHAVLEYLKIFRSLLLKTSFLCCFLFCLLFFSPFLSHHYSIRYFNSSEVDQWSRIRVLPGGHITYIIFQSQLIFLQYLHVLFLNLLNYDDGSFPHSAVRCSSEDNITTWLLNNLWLEDNHGIICPAFLYLNRCRSEVCYPIDFFILGTMIDLYRGNTCLGVGGKFGRTEGWGGSALFLQTVPDDVSGR